MIAFRTVVAAFLVVFTAATASAQNTMVAPGSGEIATIPQVELTEESAKGAVDAYAAIREKYGDRVQPRTTAEGYAALDGANAIVGSHGFNDTADWHKALTSVALAYGFAKDGKSAADVDASLAKMRDNPQIPDNLKKQMMAMIAGLRPSENNLTVVRSLMADSSYASKLETLK